MSDKINKFHKWMEQADSINLDDNAVEFYYTSETTGEPENQVGRVNWYDGRGEEFVVYITEQGIEEGRWVENNFLCEDSEGDEITITAFKSVPFKLEDINLNG